MLFDLVHPGVALPLTTDLHQFNFDKVQNYNCIVGSVTNFPRISMQVVWLEVESDAVMNTPPHHCLLIASVHWGGGVD